MASIRAARYISYFGQRIRIRPVEVPRRFGCYQCKICLGYNVALRMRCQYCGTIPKGYSISGDTERSVSADYKERISVRLAHGYDRVEWHHTRKVYFRTVPADYYAAE